MKLRECVSSVKQYPRNTYSTSHPCIRIAFMIMNNNYNHNDCNKTAQQTVIMSIQYTQIIQICTCVWWWLMINGCSMSTFLSISLVREKQQLPQPLRGPNGSPAGT
jgi:hypothetical protein